MRVAGHDALVFVEDIQKMAQVIADNAQDGDVVMCMGAGSIGQVPTQVLALMQHGKKS
jgi:UDP-N-acetylmuramate--alanine ligase